ncbi:hypothetical protein GCM10022200_04550 [Microbacterium awajiense]|uniref:DUF3093 domain-containing protein n=1 Tax=Microbacterium awajiense TaxID=415214 RepID=A0ABP7A5L0_9MICO
MQKDRRRVRAPGEYRERLSPSLWVLVAAAVCAPMAALVIAPIDTTLALGVGAVVGIGVVALLVVGAPVVEVRDGTLRAGRAHIEVCHLGDAVALTGERARHARGSGLDPRAWHIIRGGIDGVVTVAVLDPDDPAPTWVISTRTPDRLAAAVRSAQRATPRTPCR